jgi:hypothetical protein
MQRQTKKLTQVESYNAMKKMAQVCCAVFSMWPSLPHWNPDLHFFYVAAYTQLSPFMVAGRALWHQRQHVPSFLPLNHQTLLTHQKETDNSAM